MDTHLLAQLESLLRLGCFIGIFLLMIAAEYWAPRRGEQNRLQRWPANIGLVVLNTLLVRLILPGATVWIAYKAQLWNIGVFNWLGLPQWVEFSIAVVLLDCGIYWQHRFAHSIPMLWQVHKMHHTDTQYDVTTGSRFHPIEIIISLFIKLAMIMLIGASALAVVIFEVLLNATAMFNHSNFKIPISLDGQIRKAVVTPDMHRVHHSVHADEFNCNFGFNLSIWDRAFGTYRDQPRDGHETMLIGLPDYRAAGEARIDRLISQPFRKPLDKVPDQE